MEISPAEAYKAWLINLFSRGTVWTALVQEQAVGIKALGWDAHPQQVLARIGGPPYDGSSAAAAFGIEKRWVESSVHCPPPVQENDFSISYFLSQRLEYVKKKEMIPNTRRRWGFAQKKRPARVIPPGRKWLHPSNQTQLTPLSDYEAFFLRSQRRMSCILLRRDRCNSLQTSGVSLA